RGCRLGITHPDIYKMQVRAIMEAAGNVTKAGVKTRVEIMIPLVALDAELEILRRDAIDVIEDVRKNGGIKIDYKIGTMIELPRAALTADEISRHAEFFSFGTNDLTQTTFGFSRDDVEGQFLARYLDRKILSQNPFETLDSGVIKLIEIAVKLGRKNRPDIKLGICGEHGGDPASVRFCHNMGLDYVSCSPYRVPLARLAAAQAAIAESKEDV
ncbi:MAG TPA: pyruvate, phosphate dikinase, partial [Actinobacteria bacterium]|nr:pyruvate, phosphate dikinase [Actinomycetes bacterium]HEX21308.1 pyruvate, phosphate dikinase [Actinomycetota bacterium]